jgi:branched-chain amino acid transport system substrate-binding protein
MAEARFGREFLGGHVDRRRWLAAAVGTTLLGALARAQATGAVRIGQSLPLSGPLRPVVEPIVQGQQALLQEVATRGGVLGQRIELITLDDAADPARTVDNARRLIEDEHVASLFGFAFVPGLLRTLPLLAQHQMPLIGVYNGADIVRGEHQPYLFTTTASIRDEVEQMVRTLAELHLTRLAVAYQDNEFGRFMLPHVADIAKAHGATIACTAPVAPDGSNAAAAAQAVGAGQPHAVLLLAAGNAVLAFMREVRRATRVPVYALSLAGTTALVDQLGEAARGLAVTQVVPYPTSESSPLTHGFGQAMRRAGLAPTYDRLWGYLNASILVEVLRLAGTAPSPATILAAVEHMSHADIGGYRLSFDPAHHNGSRFVDIAMVGADGHYIR